MADYHKKGYLIAKDKMLAAIKLKRDLIKKEFSKKCKFCDKSIEWEKRYNDFCSQSCAASVRNKNRSEAKSCKGCKIEFKGKNLFCNECIKNGENFKANEIKNFDEISPNSVQTRKNWILEEEGRICKICGITEWMEKPTPIIMDHIDGNSDNNSRENLRLICPNCDAQTATFGSRNRGKGRLARRVYRKKLKDAGIV